MFISSPPTQIGQFPIPEGACVENIAHVGSEHNDIALIVMMEAEYGPRVLLHQRNIRKFFNPDNKYPILLNNIKQGTNSVSNIYV